MLRSLSWPGGGGEAEEGIQAPRVLDSASSDLTGKASLYPLVCCASLGGIEGEKNGLSVPTLQTEDFLKHFWQAGWDCSEQA